LCFDIFLSKTIVGAALVAAPSLLTADY